LILDLDETLVHSTTKPHLEIPTAISPTMKVDIKSGAFQILLHVFKRPHCDTFLRTVDLWFHVCIFTASLSSYANPVIDHLSKQAGIQIAKDKRFFREHCKAEWNGHGGQIYRKNLLALLPQALAQDGPGQERCLRNMILVDNSLMSFGLQPRNGVLIESWICDPLDTGLLDLIPMLDALRFVDDVRHILGFREGAM
jgi:CTD nuclear envelope phosphatase 1